MITPNYNFTFYVIKLQGEIMRGTELNDAYRIAVRGNWKKTILMERTMLSSIIS